MKTWYIEETMYLRCANLKKNNKMISIEVCASTINSVIAASEGGAIRVELCDNLSEGGTTPSLAMIEKSLEVKGIRTFVLIRPRSGDFVYSDIEFDIMKRDIEYCGKAGCHGVVFGVLDKNNRIDMARNKELQAIAKSYNMETTFHRAFDRLENLEEGLEEVVSIGCDRILTSGGMPTALQGKEAIRKLILQSKGRVIILAGSGMSENNVKEFVQDLPITEIHGSFRDKVTPIVKYSSNYFDEDYTLLESSAVKIREAVKRLNE